ncbi:acyl-CoA thioesterase [Sneathiella limimaris]|uniref:acyl-CoA thioesterase n=1 Tax=Sneathiella limimaris TaxID=1964213 RepID=UPI0019D1F6E9|nr:thioesterase family protein [Sneathiella limimaris]
MGVLRSMNGYVESFRGHVLNSECDLMGHLNIQFYGAYISQAMQNMFFRIGFPVTEMRDTKLGFAAVDQKSKYRKELMAGDIIHMMSAVAQYSDKSVTFHHQLFNSATGELSFESLLTVLHFDMSARKACSFEPETLELLANLKLNEEVSL